jgi:hypothetical protein
VSADPITGSRSTPGPPSTPDGVVAADGWDENNGGFKIEWLIALSSDGTYYDYTYTISDEDGTTPIAPGLSHWILEVSPDITDDNRADYIWDITGVDDVESDVEVNDYASGPGNPDMPDGGIHGIKFNNEPGATVTFKSNRIPVWGDFYAKDGQHGPWATAWNTDFGEPTDDVINKILTPDGIIPEPSTILLVTLSFVGITALGIRKKLKGTSSHK